jgi:hypothetical protein
MSAAETTRPDKEFARLRAIAALAGVELYRTEDDRGVECFVLTRGPLTRVLPDLAAVEAWLARVEGRAA